MSSITKKEITVPFFSIVVPVYNVEAYLADCIDSLLRQTYQDYEIILVDDASTDNSGQICDRYQLADSRISVVHLPQNSGLSLARKAGVDLANGAYLLFVDSDDYVSDKLLETVLEPLQKSDLAYLRFNLFFDRKGQPPQVCFSRKNALLSYSSPSDKFYTLVDTILKMEVGWSAVCAIYKTRLIQSSSVLFLPDKEIYSEDLSLTLFYYMRTENLLYLGEPLYYYRIRPGSINQSNLANARLNELNNLSFHFHNSLHDPFFLENYSLIHAGIINARMSILLHHKLNTISNVFTCAKGIEKRRFFQDQFRKLLKREDFKRSHKGAKRFIDLQDSIYSYFANSRLLTFVVRVLTSITINRMISALKRIK